MQGTVVKIEVRMGSGRVEYERLAEKKKTFIHIPLWEKEKQMKRMHRHAA